MNELLKNEVPVNLTALAQAYGAAIQIESGTHIETFYPRRQTSTYDIFEPSSRKWGRSIIEALPERFRRAALNKYKKIIADSKIEMTKTGVPAHQQDSRAQYNANNWLRKLYEIIQELTCYSIMLLDHEELNELAKKKADEARTFITGHTVLTKNLEISQNRAIDELLSLSTFFGVKIKRVDFNTDYERITDPLIWRKHLHHETAKAREMIAFHLGIVHRDRQIYCSDLTLIERKEQLKNMDEFLRSRQIQSGDTILSLIDCARTPYMRWAERYMIVKEMEELSKELGLTWSFIVATCPPEYHPNPGNGGTKWDGKLTPSDGNKYINDGWREIQKKIDTLGIRILGLWTSEPHKDGTPHKNFLIFHAPWHTQQIHELFKDQFGDEPATKIELNDGRASAASYVAKYIMKTVSYAEAGDADMDDAVARCDAWRARWGIRAFQLFGVDNCIGKWREFRKKRTAPDQPELYRAWDAAKNNRFKEFLSLSKEFAWITEKFETKYGEISRRIIAIQHTLTQSALYRRVWKIIKPNKKPAVILSSPRDGGLGSFFNNKIHESPLLLN